MTLQEFTDAILNSGIKLDWRIADDTENHIYYFQAVAYVVGIEITIAIPQESEGCEVSLEDPVFDVLFGELNENGTTTKTISEAVEFVENKMRSLIADLERALPKKYENLTVDTSRYPENQHPSIQE